MIKAILNPFLHIRNLWRRHSLRRAMGQGWFNRTERAYPDESKSNPPDREQAS